MITKSDICIVIPAYNEAPVIGEVVRKIRQCGYENIVVVNDGSKDGTQRVAFGAGARVLSHPINRGAGAAAQTGIAHARRRGFEYIVQIDADGQHFPEDIEAMIDRMDQDECDIIIGSRFLERREGVPQTRRMYNRLSNIFTNFFCRGRYSDSQSGMRMLNRRAIELMDLRLDGFGYCSEMIILAEKLELSIREVPISVAYTEYSMSKGQDLQMGINTALNLLWKLIFH